MRRFQTVYSPDKNSRYEPFITRMSNTISEFENRYGSFSSQENRYYLDSKNDRVSFKKFRRTRPPPAYEKLKAILLIR